MHEWKPDTDLRHEDNTCDEVWLHDDETIDILLETTIENHEQTSESSR